ncbi:formyltransferase family protein [Pseudoalteromonas sp. SSDWG2]|uniref:formyltransferase family protein n=1 Tax=Pseudoalteromonas sp. SSDWG2 TaxID=3139391 RepID=UPI003BA8A28C
MSEQPKVLVYANSLFAWPCIEALQQSGQLVGVITPDPQERNLAKPALMLLMQTLTSQGIPFEVVCKDKLSLIPTHLPHFNADVALCLGFSYLLPTPVLDHYLQGVYNCHASALPSYAGKDPIYWQLREQHPHSALTWQRMNERYDSGAIISSHPMLISSEDTYASLTQRFAFLALQSLPSLFTEINTHLPQQDLQPLTVTYTDQPPDFIHLDLQAFDAEQLDALTRAHNGHFGRCLLSIKGMDVELIQVSVVDYPTYGTRAGTVVMVSQTQGLIVATKKGCMRVDIVSCELGTLSGERLAQLINLDAGELLSHPPHQLQQHL